MTTPTPTAELVPASQSFRVAGEHPGHRTVSWSAGTQINRVVDAEEACKLAGLDFEVELRPAGYLHGKTWLRAPDRVAVVRKDTGKFFNYASDQYTPVQYPDAAAFLNEIGPEFVAGGGFAEGKQAYFVIKFADLAQLDLQFAGKADPHSFYVVFRTSQNLSRGIQLDLVTLRHACMNQFALPPLVRGVKQSWSIRHMPNVTRRMHDAQDVLTRSRDYVDAYAGLVERLVNVQVDDAKVKDTLELVLPDRPRRESQIEAILDTYRTSPYNGFQGTGWGVVNAVSEYLEHTRPATRQTAQSRFTGPLDGQVSKLVNRTAQLLLRQASA